jgi:transcriptional regulator with XRE-family HTH domain
MTTSGHEDRFAEYLDQYVSYLEGSVEEPRIDHLDARDRRELSELFRIIDANWAAEIELPPLEDDPIAIALGLVPQPRRSEVLVGGTTVRALRQARGLQMTVFAATVSRYGWPITARNATLLERAQAQLLTADQAAALARALGTGIEALEPSNNDPVKGLLTWLYSDEFERTVLAWAPETSMSASDVAEEARTKMLVAAKRSSGHEGRTEWIQTLRAILEAMA